MEIQRLYSYARKAIDEYHMIEDGDKIAIGISGGKDSLTLLYALAGLRRFYPKKFDIVAITVHLGIDGMDFAPIVDLCKELDVEYHIVQTEIYKTIFEIRQESNPCSLCAKMRKGAFNEKAKELGCNKFAYAHHKDDLVETLYMSLIFEGRLHTFSPMSYMDRMELTLIRPLMFTPEADIIGFTNKYNLPVVKNKCPADGYTKRQYIKDHLKKLQAENPGVIDRSFTAILNADFKDWPQRFPHAR